MLRCLGGNAPYLADLAVREEATLRLLAREGPQTAVDRAMATLRTLAPASSRATIAAGLRQAKRQVALATAVADLGGLWTLDQVTGALSDLAQATLDCATAHLLLAAHISHELTLPDPSRPTHACGFVALGMGKLGGHELNYSSDIDLVLLHDLSAGVYHGESPVAFYARLTRDLVSLMETRDADGYVFRTDLRLRPDPAATPPCIALEGAISYYEGMGQTWERAAMLKARPVAGDLAMGAAFLAAIRPFVWRRHLDFAAVADIQMMKRRIDSHKGFTATEVTDRLARIAGCNVKLGRGGIREIEFIAQTLQLVWGGQDPALRLPRTEDALRALVRAGHMPRRRATRLRDAYRFLRSVEHRLQMVNDRQTHSLPDQPEQIEAFAIFMGFDNAAAFADRLLAHQAVVEQGFGAVFSDAPKAGAPTLAFGTGGDELTTAATLTGLGFRQPEAVIAAVQRWHDGKVRALRSARALAVLDELLPLLLAALARQAQPDQAFARFDALLGRLTAGVQLLSLFQHNPRLLDRVAAALGAAPMLAEHLARNPAALEGLLAPEQMPDVARLLRARLTDADTLEDGIDIIRDTVRSEEFSIAVATLEGRIDADAAGLARAELADAALGALLPRVLADFVRRFGTVRGGGLAVVLMGKAGGQEMMAGSDLDMMLIYDHPEAVHSSTARPPARSLPCSQWFIRAVHAYVAAATAPDADGPMYPIDMRLRPSGNKGPVAVSLRGFEAYHGPLTQGEGAWTWERMALTRARVVAGPPALCRRIAAAIAHAITQAGPPDRIRADALAMRRRLLKDLPATGPWDVKLRLGGQIDVEFIAQTLLLLHAPAHPKLASPTTRIVLARLNETGLLPAQDAALLIHADHVWRTTQGILRVTYGRAPTDGLSPAATTALLRALANHVDAVDLAGLHATFDNIAGGVRAVFTRHVGSLDP